MIFIQFLFMAEGVEPLEFNATSLPIVIQLFSFFTSQSSPLMSPLACPSCANCYELYIHRRIVCVCVCVCLGR